MKVLFISYDGLTDPLGPSQILPYVLGLQGRVSEWSLLTFEKGERFRVEGPALAGELSARGVRWHPLKFSRRPQVLAKAWDLLRMYVWATWVAWRRAVSVVHCRSYQAVQVGLWLKWILGVRIIFDMRGLWADERVDGDLWNLERPLHRRLYQFYRGLERTALQHADQVVTLTDRSVGVLNARCPDRRLPISVIPCCADFDHFRRRTPQHRLAVRRQLGLDHQLVLGYLGSLGTWYPHAEMFAFYRLLLERFPGSHFLLITLDWSGRHEQAWEQAGLAGFRSRLHLRPAARREVPDWLAAVDLGLSLIKPAFSKVASSPTKVAEFLAMGIPVISNAGVGDLQEHLEELRAGLCLKDFSQSEMRRAVERVPELLAMGGEGLRQRAREKLDLPVAHRLYHRLYDSLALGDLEGG